ncbi:MAG: putative baseplate assembly protein [Gemmatimonadaceae bacterium]
MSGTVFLCCDDHRRAALQEKPVLNGIDFLEVADLLAADLDAVDSVLFAALPTTERDRLLWQRKLSVFFVNPLSAAHLAALTPATIRIDGGERSDSRNISVTILSKTANSVTLRTSVRGDGSIYRLSVVASADTLDAPASFDPMLSAVDFSFRADCPSEFDCAPACDCPPVETPRIDIDYLARDYATFRRLMLDRIAVLSPEWTERHAPDLGITLVELVAYVADYLAYRQDAVATEAYLGTARKRISVRRHARLVDYPMHDGCNARVWVQVLLDNTVSPSVGIVLPRANAITGVTTKFLTRVAASPVLDDAHVGAVLANLRPEVFEPLVDTTLFPQHNELFFYSWGASDCCLPKGATRATLLGHLDKLKVGDVLVFEEICGPETGEPGDANPNNRVAVRLTNVRLLSDPLGGRFETPATNDSVDVTSIEWSAADALPFPLCVSATVTDVDGGAVPIVVSVARGNIVVADHGLSVTEVVPDAVPAPSILRPSTEACGCDDHAREPVPIRFRPILQRKPITCAAPFNAAAAASAMMRWDVGSALPAMHLESDAAKDRWAVHRDLLGSSSTARDFVAEIETDSTAQLRFGDGVNGMRPVTATVFTAFYRVGNGTRGNVGSDSIAHIATTVIAGIDHVRNLLPAVGGIDLETVEDVRRFAPVAFRTQQRAVTTDDYATMAGRHPQIQQAAATFRWTGSWRTVFVTVDPFASKTPDSPFDPELPVQLEPFRMAGHDLEINTPRFVPVEVAMQVCAKRDYFRSDVKRALLEIFSDRVLPNGTKGVFHEDNFTFGQPIYLSVLYAAAYAVDGVDSVKITQFQRQGTPSFKGLIDGVIAFGRLEIAQLENSANFPDRGVFKLDVAGGK